MALARILATDRNAGVKTEETEIGLLREACDKAGAKYRKRLFAETLKRFLYGFYPHTLVASGSPNRISTTTIRAGASTAQPHGDPGAPGFRKND